MKTADEIYEKEFVGRNFYQIQNMGARKGIILHMMDIYADQFKYDYSQECKCGDNTTGSIWCCNICGLPTCKKPHPKAESPINTHWRFIANNVLPEDEGKYYVMDKYGNQGWCLYGNSGAMGENLSFFDGKSIFEDKDTPYL